MKFLLYIVLIITQMTIRKCGCNRVLQQSGDFGIVYELQCPNSGNMIGINYRATEKVDAMEVICTSLDDQSTLGPFGDSTNNGTSGSLMCPEEHYISSFFGSNSIYLNRLGIRCRRQNDTDSRGTTIGEFGQEKGTNFDEITESLGAWPVSININLINSTIGAFKGVYRNSTLYKITNDNSDCSGNERFVSHGQCNSGCEPYEVVCPDEGVVIEVSYTSSFDIFSGYRLHSIKFACISSAGITYEGPYGTPVNDIVKELKCPKDHHINYFKGRVGDIVNELDIVCTKSGQAAPKNNQEDATDIDIQKDERNALDARKHVTNKTYKGKIFNDFCYGSKGKRPVKIIVGHKTYITLIAIVYEAVPVAFKCNRTQMILTGDTTPKIISYEMLGLVVGSTCSSIEQELNLSVEENKKRSSVTDSSISNTKQQNEYNGLGLNSGVWFGGGSEIEVEVGLEIGDQNVFSTIESRSSSSDIDKTQKTAINYQGPGASFLVGYISRYELNNEKVDVLYRYKCERGSTPPVADNINLYGHVYGNVQFMDFYFPFGDTNCTTKLRMCISRINLADFVFRPKSLNEKLSIEVNRCLTDN